MVAVGHMCFQMLGSWLFSNAMLMAAVSSFPLLHSYFTQVLFFTISAWLRCAILDVNCADFLTRAAAL